MLDFSQGFSPATHLLITIAAPLVGAVAAWLLGHRGLQAVRQSAAVTSLITLGLAGTLVLRFLSSEPTAAGAFFASGELGWFVSGPLDIRFSVGLDGLSIWLFGLSALLTVTAVFVSWEAVQEKAVGFYSLLLLLEAAMLGVFAARDIILFYVFFEFTLVPLFFLIGIWGHDDRRRAAVKFFLYTFAGSVLAFLGLLAIVLWHASHTGVLSFDIATLTAGLSSHPLPMTPEWGYLQFWVFIALFVGFAIKVPIVPVHTWLPLAHVEAPTGGSVDLAGVLLKIGIYGFLRFSLPMLPEAAAMAAHWLVALGAIGIIYGALVALVQKDLKRMVAYSSVSHMGYCVMGLFALEPVAVEGANLQLINHGLASAGLFATVGMIYERYHTRKIADLGGIASQTPWLATFFMLFTFSAIGLPGLNGFVGEFMVLAGTFQRAWSGAPADWASTYLVLSLLAVAGVVLGAWYMLQAVERVLFGQARGATAGEHGEHARDIAWYELAALAPLGVFIVWIGVFPSPFLAASAPAVTASTQASAQAFASRVSASRAPLPADQTAPSQPDRMPAKGTDMTLYRGPSHTASILNRLAP
jgi:NADH-quinone oxidoreductase subunit M